MPLTEFALILGLICCAGPLRAQRAESGFLDRTVMVGEETYRYQIYVPADSPGESRWPVILFLHGAGERGRDGILPTRSGLGPAIRRHPERFPAIVVFPQARPDSQWAGAQADMALATLAKTLDEFPVDQDRIYLTGLSMGGHGTWYLAYRNPERFAAVAPICGWTWGRPEGEFPAPVVPVEDGAPLPALARRLAGTPLWLFHGALDSVVPARGSREPAEALKAVSANVHYTEYPGLDHNSWDAAYGSEEFVHWLLAQRRRGH